MDSSLPGQLGSLADNGGPTETIAPQAGNPALGLIPNPTSVTLSTLPSTPSLKLCATVDQRGVSTPAGVACDAGAVQNVLLLTVTASSVSFAAGGALPAITASYSGFVNGDSASSLSAPAICSTTATSSSPPGSYPSTCTSASDPKYSIAYGAEISTAPPPDPAATNLPRPSASSACCATPNARLPSIASPRATATSISRPASRHAQSSTDVFPTPASPTITSTPPRPDRARSRHPPVADSTASRSHSRTSPIANAQPQQDRRARPLDGSHRHRTTSHCLASTPHAPTNSATPSAPRPGLRGAGPSSLTLVVSSVVDRRYHRPAAGSRPVNPAPITDSPRRYDPHGSRSSLRSRSGLGLLTGLRR